MKLISQDIFNVKTGIICHQVNCMGVFGSGIALDIKKKWPMVFEEYRNKMLMPRYKNLGRAQVVNVGEDLYVANLFGQFDYGRDFRRTEYGSIYTALKNLKKQIDLKQIEDHKDRQVFFPYKMSCQNAGGDWNLLMEMLDELFPDCYICKID